MTSEVCDMSDGGLLQKAMEQQTGDTELVAEAVVTQSKSESRFNQNLKIGLGLTIVSALAMWGYSLPSIQSDFAFAVIIPIGMGAAAWWFVWNGLDRKHTEVVSVVLILLLASPFMAMSLSSSSVTITDSQLSDDATTISLTIRESGGLFGSPSGDADVTITYDGEQVWSTSTPFSIDREDGYGKYGLLTLTISDFYSGNAADDAEYVASVKFGGSSDSITLSMDFLERTVGQVKNAALPAMGSGSDCEANQDNCVVGVGLKAWAGLPRLPSAGDPTPPPAPLAHADFELSAVLSTGGVSAIEFPTVSVNNGEVTWDSDSGTYGGGLGAYGDFGSQITLDGSVEDISLNMLYIPRDDWSENDLGCYEFTVTVTQSPPWGDRTAHTSSTFYELTEDGDGETSSESWTEVDSC